jgi:hypothetical protein
MNNKEQRRGICSRHAVRDLVIFYLNGDVTDNQRKIIKRHMSHCFDCQDEFRFFLALRQLRKQRT